MITTGMVRKIDLLGRIVIPKEIRKNLKIESGDDIEMYMEKDYIVLKKYQAIDNYIDIAKSYCRSIYDSLHINCFICSKERVIAATKNSDEIISENLYKIITKGENIFMVDDFTVPLYHDEKDVKYKSQFIAPINCMGDVYGAIVAYSTKNEFNQKEKEFILNAALFLCGQVS